MISAMRTERRARSSIGAVWLAVALLGGCSERETGSVPIVAPAQAAQASQLRAGQAVRGASQFAAGRCAEFAQDFDELTACRRADGTLESFSDREIGWRVRYFVRYWQMPCNEAPTIEEGYVYHMVTKDLYKDPDLDDRQRMAIRTAMFDGKADCK